LVLWSFACVRFGSGLSWLDDFSVELIIGKAALSLGFFSTFLWARCVCDFAASDVHALVAASNTCVSCTLEWPALLCSKYKLQRL
jgi:hypothetical protein